MSGTLPLYGGRAGASRPIALARRWIGAAVLLASAAAPAAGRAAANVTSCVLSQNEVLQRSQPAANAGVQLQRARQTAQAAYDLASRDIDSDARMLDSLKASLPANVAQSRLQDIANRRVALQRRTDDTNRELVKLNDRLGAGVMQQAGPAIRDIALAQGCGIVLPREAALQIVDPSLDLTAAVIQRLATLKPTTDASR